MQIGITELIVIIFLIIAVVKPSKLESYAGSLGKAMRDVKNATKSVTEPIQEVGAELQEVVSEVKGESK